MSHRTPLQLPSTSYIGSFVAADIAHAIASYCVAESTIERHLQHPHGDWPLKETPSVVIHRAEPGRQDLEDELHSKSSCSGQFVQTLVDGVLYEAQNDTLSYSTPTYSNPSSVISCDATGNLVAQPTIPSDAFGNIVSTTATIAINCTKESKCDVESNVISPDSETAQWSEAQSPKTANSQPIIWTEQASESASTKPTLWTDDFQPANQHPLPRTPTQSPEAESVNSPSPYQSPIEEDQSSGLWIASTGATTVEEPLIVAPVISRLRLGELPEKQFSIESDLSTERGQSSTDSDDERETDFPPPREEDEDLLHSVEGVGVEETVAEEHSSPLSEQEVDPPQEQAPSPPVDELEYQPCVQKIKVTRPTSDDDEEPSRSPSPPTRKISFDHLDNQDAPTIVNSQFRSAKSRRKASTTSPGRKDSTQSHGRKLSSQANYERSVSVDVKETNGNLNGNTHKPIYLFENSSDSDIEVDMADKDDDYQDVDLSQFVYECHTYHNTLRARHGVPPIELDEDMCEQACKWARRLTRKKFMTYAEYTAVGESVTFFPAHFSGTEAMAIWSSEAERYDYEQPGWQVGTNYFTQMVWRNTTHMGVGRALMPRDHICTNIHCSRALKEYKSSQLTLDEINQRHAVVVVLYRPSGNGNRPGEFQRNVRLPIEMRPNASEDENR